MPKTYNIPIGATQVTVPDAIASVSQADPSFVVPTPPANHAPIVSIDPVPALTLPVNSVQLMAHATDPDSGGTVSSVMWEIRAGSGSIDNSSIYNPVVSNLPVGTTTLRFTAIDNLGASSFVDVNIIVHDVTPPPTTGWKLIYSNGFDKDADLDPFSHQQFGKGFIDYKDFFEGLGCFHSRPGTQSSGERSEVSFDAAQSPNEGATEYMVKYNYLVKDFCHSYQFHPNTSGGSASPGLWHVNGQLVWRNWTAKTSNVTHGPGFTPTLGQWYKFRFEYKFGSNGYFRFYIDDKLISSWTGQVGDGSGQYQKMGFNGNFDGNKTEADRSDIQYDSYKVYIPA